jgi:hypothetical protein
MRVLQQLAPASTLQAHVSQLHHQCRKLCQGSGQHSERSPTHVLTCCKHSQQYTCNDLGLHPGDPGGALLLLLSLP